MGDNEITNLSARPFTCNVNEQDSKFIMLQGVVRVDLTTEGLNFKGPTELLNGPEADRLWCDV